MEFLAQTPLWIWWLVFAIVLVILETVVSGFVLIWFALGALVTLVGALIPGLGISAQIGLFALASVAGVFLLRPYLRAGSNVLEDDRELNRFEANLVGSPGIVTEAIKGGQGRARVGDSTWTVVGADMPAKTSIRVVSVKGIVLEVMPDAAA